MVKKTRRTEYVDNLILESARKDLADLRRRREDAERAVREQVESIMRFRERTGR